MNESYYYGQGKLELAKILSGGGLGPWVWVGDVSTLDCSFEKAAFTHLESFSGNKAEVREIGTGKTLGVSATLHQLDTDNVARFTEGTNTEVAAGTVSAESLGIVAVGDEILLDHYGATNLVITDSAGSPVTIAPSHYEFDEFNGLKFLTLPSSPAPTMPLKAAYSHAAYNVGAFLNGTPAQYALRYRGVNLAEGNQKVELIYYKVSAGLLQTLSMITNGQQLAAAPITFKPLLDTSKPTDPLYGQYGRLVTIG